MPLSKETKETMTHFAEVKEQNQTLHPIMCLTTQPFKYFSSVEKEFGLGDWTVFMRTPPRQAMICVKILSVARSPFHLQILTSIYITVRQVGILVYAYIRGTFERDKKGKTRGKLISSH